jgi:hypothetical protein
MSFQYIIDWGNKKEHHSPHKEAEFLHKCSTLKMYVQNNRKEWEIPRH